MNKIPKGQTCYNCGYPLFDKRCINPECKEYSLLSYISDLKEQLEIILNMTNVHGLYENDSECVNAIRQRCIKVLNNR